MSQLVTLNMWSHATSLCLFLGVLEDRKAGELRGKGGGVQLNCSYTCIALFAPQTFLETLSLLILWSPPTNSAALFSGQRGEQRHQWPAHHLVPPAHL